MKSKMNIKGIIIMAVLVITVILFINISLAANTAKIVVETANLRETANEDGKILDQISINNEVEVIEKQGDWYKVKYNNVTGYLRQDLIQVKEEVKNETAQESTNTTQETSTTTTNDVVTNEAYKIKNDTRLKIVPSINAIDIIEVKKDQEVTSIEKINGWICVQTSTTKGWIREENIQKAEPQAQTNEEQPKQEEVKSEPQPETVIKTLYVNSSSINLREEASTTSNIVANLLVNTVVDVYKEENGWSKVKVKSTGKDGYISTSLLSKTKKETSRAVETPRKTTTSNSESKTQDVATGAPSSSNGGSAVSIGMGYIGCSYVYGGSTPSGFDCSGFTSYVYRQIGVSLNRTAAGQYRNGVSVSKSELQPGDLVMFGKSGINHVGIYIGGGSMVHAANKQRGVTTDTINSGYYYNNYVGARRIN